MSLEYHVLGGPGRDNALLVYVHTGQAVVRLLFDCGEGCLSGLPFAEIQRIDYLGFSHLHMDHIGGFDAFFRCTYNRVGKPNVIWGPPDTARILHHRLQGFLWNLHTGKEASWRVYDVHPDRLTGARFELAEAFAIAYPEPEMPSDGTVLATDDFVIETVQLEHFTPVLGYIVRESPRTHVDRAHLHDLGLPPGPWVKEIKKPQPGQTEITVAGKAYPLEDLQTLLLTEEPGDAVAYLTDFRLDDAAREALLPRLRGCRVVVCESTYREAEFELAAQNAHLTTVQAATLARDAEVGKLVLIHLSERYSQDEWPDFLREARAIFPNTVFPKGWLAE